MFLLLRKKGKTYSVATNKSVLIKASGGAKNRTRVSVSDICALNHHAVWTQGAPPPRLFYRFCKREIERERQHEQSGGCRGRN